MRSETKATLAAHDGKARSGQMGGGTLPVDRMNNFQRLPRGAAIHATFVLTAWSATIYAARAAATTGECRAAE